MEGDEENNKQRMIERVVSQKALALSSSFPCQICVVGFLSGVCLTSLFLAALTSFGSFTFGSSSSSTIWPWNSSSSSSSSTASPIINMITTGGSSNVKMGTVVKTNVSISKRNEDLLYSAWSLMLHQSVGQGEVTGKAEALKNLGLSSITSIPKAPHVENCKLRAQVNQRLDRRANNSSLFPPWTIWKGLLDLYPAASTPELDSQLKDNLRNQDIAQGAYPPWVTGSDGENYPLTRKVQRDIWLYQHPVNCHDPQVKFLVADWERPPGFGIGAQIAGMCGLLAIAIKEKRVLVTNYYNRADHDDCKGSARASWSCYFFPETSQECRDRALELMQQKEAWVKGTITGKDNYTSKEIWAGRTPRTWGEPWHYLQPTTEINGSFVAFHRKMDRRWWRAQAVRYLMRFPTEYTCQLLNLARHLAFGRQAAKMVLASYNGQWPKEEPSRDTTEIEKYVWSSHKPWIPRPLLSIHVRMGDKACEMNVVGFEEYMSLADRMRKRFPQLNSIWLSTEMQEVIDRTRSYPNWNFYFSDVKRQVGNITMANYEASLGRKTSTNYPFVNFLMATEADLFIGALGSTWCFLIDGMRNTGGKVMAGYVSVNKDRFW